MEIHLRNKRSLKQVWKNISTFLLILFCTFHCISQEQTFTQKMDSLLDHYATNFENTRLHLHLDKTIYTPNETVWFSAYLYASMPDSFSHQLLYVKLVKEENDSLVRSAIFPFQIDHSSGDLLLPTSITPGYYRLIAFTDKLRNGFPAVLFKQRIQIKTEAPIKTGIAIQRMDSAITAKDSFQVMVKVANNGLTLLNRTIPVEVTACSKTIVKTKLTIDEQGKSFLTLPRKPGCPFTLKTVLTTEDEKKTIQLPVLQPTSPPQIRFFPEGGSLIANTNAMVAMEVTGSSGQPLIGAVSVYENDQLLSTVSTSEYGIATVDFFAKAGHQYKATVRDQYSGHSFDFPAMRSNGYSVQVKEGITTDGIPVVVQRANVQGNARLFLHNFKAVYWAAELRMKKDTLTFSIPTQQIPSGTYALTITNEQFQPLSERLVFVHQDKNSVSIQTNKPAYATREKINLQVQLKDTASGYNFLSLSCTDISRLDIATHASILASFFIRDELQPSLGSAAYFLQGRSQRLNEILLTKGWRSYSWPEVGRSQPFAKIDTLLPGKGKVLSKKIKGPFEITLINNQSILTSSTDSLGNFVIPNEALFNTSDKLPFLVPVKTKGPALTILMDTIYSGIDKRTTGIEADSVFVQPPLTTNFQHILEKRNGKVMEEVVIKAKSRFPQFVSKTCNDWVCQYNVLNCPNHPTGSSPIEGETYVYYDGYSRTTVVYVGCKTANQTVPKEFVQTPKISIAKEFYKPNYETQTTNEPEFLTTLYWNPQLAIKEKSFTDTFYTSDTKGTFLFILEGLVNGQPVHAQHQIEVR